MVTMDKNGANRASLGQLNAARDVPIKVRQVKYLNNICEQEHRAIKRVTRPMFGFKLFRSAQVVLADIELMHIISKGQFNMASVDGMSVADQFYTLAGQLHPE
ncbi:MAG: family transposase [Burkholderia sp.]|nr:family transposase [Burkholderia sp.]